MSLFVRSRPCAGWLAGGLLLLAVWSSPAPVAGQDVRWAAESTRLNKVADAAEGTIPSPAAAHYDVVALRVTFQPDTTAYTTGDGTFGGDLYGGLETAIDPLPHDAGYFRAHLAFLEDYVGRVSDGQTTVTTHLVPEVVQVSGKMTAYSPTGPDADSDDQMRKLAALVAEAWTLADEQSSFDMTGFDPSRTAFMLLHAGVGRDVELIGTTLDKTPQDLPSVFFDEGTLDRLLSSAAIAFGGFPVDHTMLIPRTETRRGVGALDDEPFLFGLSINGLIAASFFNYLGVPDLFDTTTGESAIGPFGLMDPLGIFAYRGLFPPEPSAWTKLVLGWSSVHELQGLGPEEVALRAASFPDATELARAVVADGEYFLVENRHRDPEGDGLILRVWQDGAVVEQRVQNGDETFNDEVVEGFVGGVVVGVDNYDWALPGGVDEDGNELNGGMLIWHVDEARFSSGVNDAAGHRAVDLEEADGAQDIGFPQAGGFGPEYHLGSPFDFYYRGNPVSVRTQTGSTVRLYENRFGPDTYPSSTTYAGGPSFVVLRDFSPPGPQMTFAYRLTTENGVRPLPGWSRALPLSSRPVEGDVLKPFPAASDTAIAILDSGAPPVLWTIHPGGEARRTGGDLLYLPPAVLPDGRLATVGWDEGGALQLLLVGAEEDVERELDSDASVVRLFGPAVYSEGEVLVGVATPSGRGVLHIDPAGGVTSFEEAAGLEALAVAPDGTILSTTLQGAAVDGERRWTFAVSGEASLEHVVFGRDRSGLVGVQPDDERLLWLLADGTVREIPVEEFTDHPVLVDLDDDGLLDVLTTVAGHLVAYTQGGAFVEGFPIRLPGRASVSTQLLVAELSDSGGWSILAAATDGNVYGYDMGRDGAPLPGFPLTAGREVFSTPLLYEGALYSVAGGGTLRAWKLDGTGEVWWGEHYGGPGNARFVTLEEPSEPEAAGGRLLVAEETYNWPNPVRDGETYLRCEVARDARVEVAIIDAAGGLVDEFVVAHVREGVPTEHLWQTDAPSGLYFARITAVAADGESDSRTVKMAIIR